MLMEQAATVRKEWSTVCDSVIHEKPKFIKPIRDKMWVQELHKQCMAVTTVRREVSDFIVHIAYNREEESQ